MDAEEESVAIFFFLARLVLPFSVSFLHCYYYYYCRVFFSLLLVGVACSRPFSSPLSLSSLTKSEGGEAVCDFDYRLFFVVVIVFSVFLFNTQREGKRNR